MKRCLYFLSFGLYSLAGGFFFVAFLLVAVDCTEWFKRGGVWNAAIMSEIIGTSSNNKAGLVAEVMAILERTPQWAAFSLMAMLTFSLAACIALRAEELPGRKF